jgi:acetyl-CoA carboxylase carboxyltransferase component
MAEMVVGEKVTLEEMGGARMHATISGCGDQLAADDTEAIEQAKHYFSYLPLNWRSPLPAYDPLDSPMILCRHRSLLATTSAGSSKRSWTKVPFLRSSRCLLLSW